MNIYATQHVQIDVTAMERVVKTMFVNVVMDLQIQIALVGLHCNRGRLEVHNLEGFQAVLISRRFAEHSNCDEVTRLQH